MSYVFPCESGCPISHYHFETCSEHDPAKCLVCLEREMGFYRTLTVSRDEGVTAIDGGKTAQNLHDLWERAEKAEARVGELERERDREPEPDENPSEPVTIRPTIAELEKILEDEPAGTVQILPSGEIQVRPPTDAEADLAALREAAQRYRQAHSLMRVRFQDASAKEEYTAAEDGLNALLPEEFDESLRDA